MTLFSAPCACREYRIPYGCNVVPDASGAMHRVSRCDGKPHAAPEFTPPARLLRVTCEHGEALWITGPTPEALLAEQGCPCEEVA